jgi:hypothetical protein
MTQLPLQATCLMCSLAPSGNGQWQPSGVLTGTRRVVPHRLLAGCIQVLVAYGRVLRLGGQPARLLSVMATLQTSEEFVRLLIKRVLGLAASGTFQLNWI